MANSRSGRAGEDFSGCQGVFLRLADAPACIISAMAVANELMASNARHSRMENQSPARKHCPPGPDNGLALRGTDTPQAKPLSGALRELWSDPLSGAVIIAYLAVLILLLRLYFNAFSNYGLF